MRSKRLMLTAVLVLLASVGPQAAERVEFTALAIPIAIAEPGDISCPGGGDPLPTLMPPWCEPGTRTKVRDRVLVEAIVDTDDPMVSGTVTCQLNMNVDSTTFTGHAWGTCTIMVPDRGTWSGVLTGSVDGPTQWSYKVVLFGSGEFEGMHLKADGLWSAYSGDRLTGTIHDPGRS